MGEPNPKLHTEHKCSVTIAIIADPQLRFRYVAVDGFAVAHLTWNTGLQELAADLLHLLAIG